MEDWNNQNLTRILAIFSSEFEINENNFEEEIRNSNKLHADYMNGKKDLLPSEKWEAELPNKMKRENFIFREEFRKSFSIKTNPKGGHGGLDKKIFNSLIRSLVSYFTNNNGLTNWISIIIILLDTPVALRPIFPYRDEIAQKHLKNYLRNNDSEIKATISFEEFNKLESHLIQDYKKLHSKYIHIDNFERIVKSLRKALSEFK